MGILGTTGFYGAADDKARKRSKAPMTHDPMEDRPVPTEEQDGDDVVSDWTYDPTPSAPPKRKACGRSWISLHQF